MAQQQQRLAFSKRLNHALDLNKVPRKGKGRQVTVAKMFGVSQKGASKWLEGQAYPDIQKMAVIAKKLNVSVEWLTYGDGPINVEPVPGPGNMGWRKIPIVPWGQADSIDAFEPSEDTEWTWTDIDSGPHTYALIVEDDSMEPRFEPGCIITADPDLKPTHRRIVIVKWLKTGTISCAQYLEDGPNIYLKPHNPNFVATLLDEQNPQAEIIATAIQVFMRY